MRKVFAALAIAGAMLVSGCAEQIDAGHRGVRMSFGEVEQVSLPEGLYWYNPIGGAIVEMDVRQLKWSAATAAYTRDVQQATVAVTINYRLQPDKAHTVYQTVGDDWANSQLPQIVFSAIKNEAGKWNAVDIIANRATVQKTVEEAVAKALAPKYIVVERVEITNIDYDPAFEKAVEAKVIAEQDALRSKNQTVQIQEQAKQSVIQAQAEADSQLVKAEAEAKSIRIRADALAQNPKLVELEAVKQWDGKLPQYVLGNGSVPFINLNK